MSNRHSTRRVEIPAYHDHWMRGDRYGDVKQSFNVMVDGQNVERLRVSLDKSGDVVTVIASDCTEV